MMKKTTFTLMAAAMLIPSLGFGAAFQMYDIDSAETLGLAGAVSARKDIVGNAWHNPAATAWFERPTLQVSGALIKMSSDREGIEGVNSSLESDSYEAFPSLFYIQPLNSDLTFSLAVTGPYGMATHWNEDTWTKTSPHYPTSANMPMGIYPTDTFIANIYVSPSIAYKVTNNFSVALGFNLVGGMVNASKWNPDNSSSLEADTIGLGWGWNISAYWDISDEWSIGAKYQSDVHMSYNGNADCDGAVADFEGQDVHTELRMPQSLSVGVVNRSFSNWILSADVVWTDWSSMNDFWFKFDSVTYSEEKNWKPVVSYRFGAEYLINENWSVRCGYAYDNSPIPEHTRSAELPGSDYHQVSVGVSYKQATWSAALAYSHWFYKSCRDGDGSRYDDTSVQVLSLSFTKSF